MPLPGEGRVAVDQQRQAARAVGVAHAVLLGAHAPLDDRVDPLEVAGVERQRQVHPVRVGAGAEDPIDRVAQVVLDVAAALAFVLTLVEELGEDLRGRLLHHVGQHVEAAAVRHADDDLDDVGARGALDQAIQQRDEALGALQREALGPEELVVQELLEDLGVDHLLQEVPALLVRQSQAVARALHAVLQPAAQLDVVQVRQLDADVAAIGLAQQLDQVAQGGAIGTRRRSRC